jgi:hypothetical protein
MDPFDVYQRDIWSGCMALAGVCATVLFSIVCVCCGIYIALHRHTIEEVVVPPAWRNVFPASSAKFTGLIAMLPTTNSVKTELLSLTLNLVVTLCTESTGFVHSVSLKSALACESRLHNNTNLRLLTAARGKRWTNPNGTLFNVIMALLLITSYVSSALIFIPFGSEVVGNSEEQWWNTCVFATPVLTLGTALLLQAVIVMAGVRQTKILTWSSSPLDTTAALLHDGRLTHIPGRCMHNVLDSTIYIGPRPPLERQPSAWQSHRAVKKVIVVLWGLVLSTVVWCGIIWCLSTTKSSLSHNNPNISWSMLPNDRTNVFGWMTEVDPNHGYPAAAWLVIFIIFIATQGSLTLGLHCSEVIVNVVRDEVIWRKAASRTGAGPSKTPVLAVIWSWQNVGLLIAKPLLRK